jgi:Ca2+-binding EF-hand superfamily protein
MTESSTASPKLGDDAVARRNVQEQETITPLKAIDILLENFNRVDKDGDKFLTKDELKSLSPSFGLGAGETQSIEAFALVTDKIQKLSNDEWFSEDNGISVNDLRKLRDGLNKPVNQDIKKTLEAGLPGKDVHDKDVFGALLASNFDRIDRDKNGTLSELELEKFRDDKLNSEESRNVAAVTLEHFEDFKKLFKEGGLGKDHGIIGPFLEGYSNDNNITKNDVDTFNELMVDSTKFDRALEEMRSSEIKQGLGMGVALTGVTAMMGASTVLVPYPSLKVMFGFVTLQSATATYFGFRQAFVGSTDDVRKQYAERQQMLSSWKHFKE